MLQHQKVLNQRVRSIYMHGQLNYLEVITGAKSFSDFANRLELLKRVIRSDYNLILEIQNQKAQIEAKEEQLEKDKARLDALAQEAQKAQSQIAAKKAEQQKVLDDAKDNKAAAAQMEQDLIAESKRVHNLIQERLRQQEVTDRLPRSPVVKRHPIRRAAVFSAGHATVQSLLHMATVSIRYLERQSITPVLI